MNNGKAIKEELQLLFYDFLQLQFPCRLPELQRGPDMHDPVRRIRLLDPGEQKICCNISHLGAGDINGGQVRVDDPRLGGIIESGDKDVLRYPDSLFLQCADQVDGNEIIGADKDVRKLYHPVDSLFEILVLLAIVIVVVVLALYAYHLHGNGDGGNRRH